MKLNAIEGLLGDYAIGMQISAIPAARGELAEPISTLQGKDYPVRRVCYVGGQTLFITSKGILDAAGVVNPYADTVLAQCRLGDSIAHLFCGLSEKVRFPANFVEYEDGILYFTTDQQLGISVHTHGITFEDGPWNEGQWRQILGGTIKSVFVCRHNEKQLAY